MLRVSSLSVGVKRHATDETASRRRLQLVPEVAGLRKAAREVFRILGCAVIPIAVFITYFVAAFRAEPVLGEPSFGWDFRALWEAAGDVLARQSPYPPLSVQLLGREDQFVYPPVSAFATIPLRLVGEQTAAVLFAILVVACAFGTLRVLGVRDWRCYGIVAVWIPVLESARLGAISAVLTFGVALAWRYRNSRWVSAITVAALIAAKVFLWPLVLWLFVTRRWREALLSVLVAGATTFGTWWLIGFGGLSDYPTMLDMLADLVAWKSYSALSLGLALGFSDGVAKLVAVALGGAALAAVVVYGRRASSVIADRQAFIAAIAAALLLSPIIWTHYFALLLVPLAIARPRLGPLWLLPLLFWISPVQSNGELWRILLGISVATVVLAGSARGMRTGRPEQRAVETYARPRAAHSPA